MDKPTVLILSCELTDAELEGTKLLEKMGVDVLVVDEAHTFKLTCPPAIEDVKEIRIVDIPKRHKDYKPEHFMRSERRAAYRRGR